MTQKAPERIWVIDNPYTPSEVVDYPIPNHPEYLLADHALALVVAEREACAKIVYQHALKNGRKIPPTYDRIRARPNDDAQAALERLLEKARNEALREAFKTLRVYAPHQVDGPEHDVGYASGYATAQNRILALITEEQSDD